MYFTEILGDFRSLLQSHSMLEEADILTSSFTNHNNRAVITFFIVKGLRYAFSVWCPLKGHMFLNKPVADLCIVCEVCITF